MTESDPLRQRARQVVRTLARQYPEARCSLDFTNPLQLLIATILSAQCTDERVNRVTPGLFARFPDARALATADGRELETAIASTGFFRNKAKSILGCCRQMVERHNGEVPTTMEELVLLPGVGRKTANVVLGTAFGIPSIPVDTHVGRLSRRLGLTEHSDPEKVEQDLMQLLPKKDWTDFSHRLIHHGRQVCQARKPHCSACALEPICPKVGVARAASEEG